MSVYATISIRIASNCKNVYAVGGNNIASCASTVHSLDIDVDLVAAALSQ